MLDHNSRCHVYITRLNWKIIHIIGHHLATKAFIGKLPATTGVWVIIGTPMMRGGQGPIRQLQDLNWGAFTHVSHAPQLRSC